MLHPVHDLATRLSYHVCLLEAIFYIGLLLDVYESNLAFGQNSCRRFAKLPNRAHTQVFILAKIAKLFWSALQFRKHTRDRFLTEN